MGETELIRELEREAAALLREPEAPMPAFPAVALEVQRALASRSYGAADVAHIVSVDALLSAGVLRIANSALYRRSEPVTTLARAISRVGVRQVFRLLVATGLASHAQAAGPLLPLRRGAWVEGLAAASVCEALARARRLHEDEAFLVGLLHDFGKVIAAACLEVVWMRGAHAPCSRADWAEAVERLHVPAGLAVARRWELPPLYLDAVGAALGGPLDPEGAPVVALSPIADAAVAVLVAGPYADLAALSGLTGVSLAERSQVAEALARVPPLVAAFEPPTARAGAGEGSAIIPEPDPGPLRPAHFEVVLEIGGIPRTCKAVGISEAGMALDARGPLSLPAAMPEDRLAHATIRTAVPFEAWCWIGAAQGAGGGSVLFARPFALDDASSAAWRALANG